MGRRHHWPGQSRGAHLESRLLFMLSLPNQAIVLFGLIHLVNSFFWTPDHDRHAAVKTVGMFWVRLPSHLRY